MDKLINTASERALNIYSVDTLTLYSLVDVRILGKTNVGL